MSRPFVSFHEVKERVTMPDVLAVLGILDQFKGRGESLTGVCPLPAHRHGPMPNPDQFKINRKDEVWLWRCFGDCQRGGDVIEFVKAMTAYDNAHVRFWFAEHFGDRLTLTKPREEGNGEPKKGEVEKETAREDRLVVDGTQAAPVTTPNLPSPSSELKPLRFRLQLDPQVPYLKERGLTEETVARYGLGLCRKGLLAGYVAIPVYRYPAEPEENPVAYLGRWPGEDYDEAAGRPRYKWPEGFAKSHVVYGLREALDDTDGQPLVVVEGVFGVFHLAQQGIRTAVSVCGSTVSDEQAALLASTGRRIVLCFDGDEAGRTGMRAAAAKLIRRAFVRVATLADGQQPDALSLGEVAAYVGGGE